MGRRVPAGDSPFTNPALYYSFFAAWIAATIAVIAAMCGVRFPWRKSTPSESGSDKKNTEEIAQAPGSDTAAPATDPSPPEESTANLDSEDATKPKPLGTVSQELPLPPPPGMRRLTESHSFNNNLSKSTSTRKMKASLSLRMPSVRMPNMSMLKREDGIHHLGKVGKPFKREDSVWTKTIILGEKCQVPDDDEDDTIIYDHKGNRVSTYHPKNPRPVPFSSSSSCIDPDALPNS